MELQEDAYRLHEILTNVSFKELVNFLRTKVSQCDEDDRFRVVLQYYFDSENKVAERNPQYKKALHADFICLKHLLVAIPDEQIKTVLKVLGPIPNRRVAAAKFLLHSSNTNIRKRKNSASHLSTTEEASSSKLVKLADSTNLVKPVVDKGKHSKIPKLVLKRDKNANEFVVTSHKKSKLELTIPLIVLEKPEPEQSDISKSDERNAEQNLDVEESSPSSSTFDPNYDAPGPSRQSWKHSPNPDQSLSQNSSEDSEATVIDLSFNNSVLTTPEVTTKPIDLTESVEPVLPADEKLVLKLMEMFPEALPHYIRELCSGRTWSEEASAEIVEIILNDVNYPRRPERQPSPEAEVDPEEQLNMLKAVLPDADPTFLQEKVDQLAGNQEALRNFIEDAVDNRNYPTMKDHLRKQKLFAQQRQYTTEFNVERFVELFPDPTAVFEDLNRKTTIIDASDIYYVKWFMRNQYSQLYAKNINSIVENFCTNNVISIVKVLNQCLANGCRKKSKCYSNLRPESQNIPLLQELAYFEHKQQILDYLEMKKKQDAEERKNAKELGLLQTCSCCFDDEVMPCDILTCTGGCRFCKDCIRRSTEVAFAEGKINFPCFSSECDTEFSLQVLQNVLSPKLFSKLAQKKAVAEVKAAGVEDLEMCPFCDFAHIPAPEDKLFRCLNPDCMKESCRLCKEPSHVPLRCEEVEKDENVKARTYIENKMTEALVRECWKCGAKFIKEDGCNKMTCSCGAMMCYICRQPVKDYKHFNGQGGDRYDLCSLYSDNFTVNENNVLKAAAEAKKEVDPTQLKNDPTADLTKHFGTQINDAKKRAEQLVRPDIEHAYQRIIGNNIRPAVIRQFANYHIGEGVCLPGWREAHYLYRDHRPPNYARFPNYRTPGVDQDQRFPMPEQPGGVIAPQHHRMEQ